MIHTYTCLVFYCIAELKENVRELEEWFKEAESVLREPLKFNQMWTRTAIDAKMEEIQVGEFTQFMIRPIYISSQNSNQRPNTKASKANPPNSGTKHNFFINCAGV